MTNPHDTLIETMTAAREAHLPVMVFGNEGTPKTMQPKPMTEDEFYTKFEPRQSPEGSDIWERHHVLAALDSGEITENHVWSFLDDGEGGTCTAAGWAVVNLLGYQVTKVPWANELETVEHEAMHTCYYCGSPIEPDEHGSWTDGTDGDGCGESPDHQHHDDEIGD